MPRFIACLFVFLLSAFSTLLTASADDDFSDKSSPGEISPPSEEVVISSLQDLFSVLSAANKYFNYQSLLTYEANGFITTYKLKHKVENNTVNQQLIFMDGPRRQVIREQGLSGCNQGATRWGLWPTILPSTSLSAYTLKTKGLERVANRQAIVFDILPKDNLRYGYRYSVDKETGLLLKVVTYYKTTIIERLQTVSIEFPDGLNEPDTSEDLDYSWRVQEVEPCHTEQFQPAWQVKWLPDGFVSVGNRITAQGEQVLMFADGLVSISVFVVNHQPDDLTKATARHGATVVVVTPASLQVGRSIAVVGEVPTATARRIAVSVQPL